jgi:hypothetical protein
MQRNEYITELVCKADLGVELDPKNNWWMWVGLRQVELPLGDICAFPQTPDLRSKYYSVYPYHHSHWLPAWFLGRTSPHVTKVDRYM